MESESGEHPDYVQMRVVVQISISSLKRRNEIRISAKTAIGYQKETHDVRSSVERLLTNPKQRYHPLGSI